MASKASLRLILGNSIEFQQNSKFSFFFQQESMRMIALERPQHYDLYDYTGEIQKEGNFNWCSRTAFDRLKHNARWNWIIQTILDAAIYFILPVVSYDERQVILGRWQGWQITRMIKLLLWLW